MFRVFAAACALAVASSCAEPLPVPIRTDPPTVQPPIQPGHAPEPTRFTIQGIALVNGKPLTNASIMLSDPEQGHLSLTVAVTTDQTGSFVIELPERPQAPFWIVSARQGALTLHGLVINDHQPSGATVIRLDETTSLVAKVAVPALVPALSQGLPRAAITRLVQTALTLTDRTPLTAAEPPRDARLAAAITAFRADPTSDRLDALAKSWVSLGETRSDVIDFVSATQRSILQATDNLGTVPAWVFGNTIVQVPSRTGPTPAVTTLINQANRYLHNLANPPSSGSSSGGSSSGDNGNVPTDPTQVQPQIQLQDGGPVSGPITVVP